MRTQTLTLLRRAFALGMLVLACNYGFSVEKPLLSNTFHIPSNNEAQSLSQIDVAKAYSLLRNKAYTWIDLRSENDIKLYGRIGNARSIRYDNGSQPFITKVTVLNRNANYIVFASTGYQNTDILESFRKLGFKNVLALKGGVVEWKKRNYPLVKDDESTPVDKDAPATGVFSLEASEAIKYAESDDVVWLDLRRSKNPKAGFIKRLNPLIDSNNNAALRREISMLGKTNHYIFFTDHGNRNSYLRRIFRQYGFKNAKSVRGGYRALKLLKERQPR